MCLWLLSPILTFCIDEINISQWPAPPEYHNALAALEDTHTIAPLSNFT